ncbi:MAG TPA: DUF503 domain-containing protein [Firmicutes bacterium]|nr:DUF503 domain-containing protein [Bacillota bacterium]
MLTSLLQRLRNRFNISIAETGYQDYWQRSEIGLAVVCHSFNSTSQIIQQIIDFIEQDGRIDVICYSVDTY